VRSPDLTIFDAKNAVNIIERARGHVVIATCADNREISRSRGLDIAVSPRSYVEKDIIIEEYNNRRIMARAKHSARMMSIIKSGYKLVRSISNENYFRGKF